MTPHATHTMDEETEPRARSFSKDLGAATTCVRIPDLFSSVMATEVRPNPLYPSIKNDAYERIRRLMKKDKNWSAKNKSVELGWLCSTWVPNANADALHTLFDYNHWVFLFDDQFDEGHLKDDPVAARLEIQAMVDIADGRLRIIEEEGMNPLRYLWQAVCDRVKAGSSSGVYKRFIDLHVHYFDGLMIQVEDARLGHPSIRSVEAYKRFRQRTIGVFPVFPICEYAEGIDIPTHAYEHPSIQEIMRISADLVWLVNDIVSFKKDQVMGVDFNFINVVQRASDSTSTGKVTIQQAVDKIGEMVDDCYRRWYRALAEMPIWGENTDRQVLRYIDICRDVALGTLHWSFFTPRYLGEGQGQEVKRTRQLWFGGDQRAKISLTMQDRDRAEMAGLYAGIAFPGQSLRAIGASSFDCY